MTETAAHQAIYRRWRAQRFGEIIGQEPVVTTLQNAVRTGRLAHALLFVGPRGTGKTSLARIVAKALNCTDLRDGEPCDRCPACVSIREGRALDVIEMDAASNNRVDDIRDLLPRIQTAPSDLRRKVFIVDEVQRIKEGWDVLLKSLEEPPDHVAFIFCTTDSSQVRPAVLSRVQRFDFRRLTVPEIEGKLATILTAEGRTAEPAALDTIARLAAGGMRDAESMLDQVLASSGQRIDADLVRGLLGLAEADTVATFSRALVDGDAAAGLAILADLEDRGLDLRVFLDQVVEDLRAAITTALAGQGASDIAGLASAASALAAIDPTRPGTGGLRLHLELALLSPRLPVSAAAVVPPSPGLRPPGPRHPGRAVDTVTTAVAASGQPPDAAQPPDVLRRRRGPTARRPENDAGSEPEPEPPRRAAEPELAPPPQAAEQAPAPQAAEPARAALVEQAPAPPGAPAEPAQPGAFARGSAAGSAGRPAAVTDGDALAALREQWPEIVAYVSLHPPTKPLISACRPISVEGNVVTLGFPEGQAFLAEVARKRGPQLEAGIGHFLGHPVAVHCVATNIDLSPAPIDADGARLLAEARRIFADDLPGVEEVR